MAAIASQMTELSMSITTTTGMPRSIMAPGMPVRREWPLGAAAGVAATRPYYNNYYNNPYVPDQCGYYPFPPCY